MFTKLQKSVLDRYQALTKLAKDNSNGELFILEIDRDKIWEAYLSGFPESIRQENTCNCCKSFLRQVGGIAAVAGGKIVTLFDGIENEEYQGAIDSLNAYLHSLPIANVFKAEGSAIGTEKNFDAKRNVNWNHFFLKFERGHWLKDSGGFLSNSRADKEVLERSLKELTQDSVATVLELINDGNLYRGEEHKSTLQAFQKLQKEFKSLKGDTNPWLWANSCKTHVGVKRIRNTSIGTILVDLSEGVDIETAIRKYESVVAPHNYRRPKALITKSMIDAAEKTINELGIESALSRRFADQRDIPLDHVIFTSKGKVVKSLFDDLRSGEVVTEKKLGKVEEISLEKFLADVLPGAQKIELLLENRHFGNFASLFTSVDPDAKNIFSWGNQISWGYTGGVTDSIKERVKAAGGNVTGVLRVSLSWHNQDDLDLHVITNGQHIFFGNRSQNGITLDVDMNRPGSTLSTNAVENIYWSVQPKQGQILVKMDNYQRRGNGVEGFTIQVEYKGETFEYHQQDNRNVNLTLEMKGGNLIVPKEFASSSRPQTKWGIGSCVYHPVNTIIRSPNHWEKENGNKHLFFILDGCKNDDDSPRAIFNEYLTPELGKHRKVFEVLAKKLTVAKSDGGELSGLGFSSTIRNEVTLRVTGKHTRSFKVKL